MKKRLFALFCLLSIMKATTIYAQNDFFFNMYGGSTNIWSTAYLQIPANIVNSVLAAAIGEDAYGGSLRYEIFNIKNNGDKIELDNGSYWGFKSKDMFSNIQYGLKFGWQPELSPFGIYVSCAYQFKKFSAQLESVTNEWYKYKMHSVRPGIGIRFTPFINMLENHGWSPILEVGTSYNYYFSCSAPFDNDKDQFQSGLISTFGIGARFEGFSVTGGVELTHYSMFNQDFTPDGIYHPYEGIKSNMMTIFIAFSTDF